VSSVPLVCAAARVPRATSMVLSTARAENRKVSITSWRRFMPLLSRGGTRLLIECIGWEHGSLVGSIDVGHVVPVRGVSV
jgi:hypothetical protein